MRKIKVWFKKNLRTARLCYENISKSWKTHSQQLVGKVFKKEKMISNLEKTWSIGTYLFHWLKSNFENRSHSSFS